jgi:hypothetical protein
MKKILIFALLIFISFDLVSQNVLLIKTKQERIEIENEYIQIYKDSTNSLINEVISSNNADKFISFQNYKEHFKKNVNYWLNQIKNISWHKHKNRKTIRRHSRN